jgi:cytochrome P450
MPMIVFMDPPRHDQLRALVSRAFTPKRIAAMEPRIRAYARELLDAAAREGGCDLVHAYAMPLPSMVIGEMIGVGEQRAAFLELTEQFVATDPESGNAAHPAREIYAIFAQLLDERRRAPADDLMSALLSAEIDGRRLADDELIGFCFTLIVAGNDTTASLVGNGAVLLANHPTERAKLRADPGLVPNAIEEMVRIESPAQSLPRTATRDIVLHGTRIPAGSRVQLVWQAANLDPREFSDPERFDVTRAIERHLGFGHGIHYCLGAALARLEARVAFEELLARFPAYRLEVEHPPRVTSSWARAYASIPVAL